MRINTNKIIVGDLIQYSKMVKNESIGIVVEVIEKNPLIGVQWSNGEYCYVGTIFIEVISRN
jgi:hypothetical protein